MQLIMEQHTVRRPLQSSFWHSTLHTNSSREGFSSSFQRTRVQHRCRAKGAQPTAGKVLSHHIQFISCLQTLLERASQRT